MAIVVFDIETGPLPDEQLRELCPPFDPLKVEGVKAEMLQPFDPESVKYGNMKDETLKAKKLTECREKHEAERKAAVKKIEDAKAGHFHAFAERAALDARTGRVAAIGYKLPNGSCRIDGNLDMAGVQIPGYGHEDMLLREFWTCYARCVSKKVLMVGHNILGFDLPFLMRRSWILGVAVPESLMERGRYWNPIFVDTMQRWACGEYRAYVKLGDIAQACDCGGKPEGEDACTGALFHTMFASPETHAKAVEYLRNDLEMTWAVAGRLGIA